MGRTKARCPPPRRSLMARPTGSRAAALSRLKRERIQTVSLYYNQGNGKRYRSLGCHPCTAPIESDARTVDEIIAELRSGKLKNVPERSGRAQDQADGGLEALRRDGYM